MCCVLLASFFCIVNCCTQCLWQFDFVYIVGISCDSSESVQCAFSIASLSVILPQLYFATACIAVK